MDGFTVKRIDELATTFHGAVKLAGDELGVQSFGLQVLDFPPSFDAYPAHDHAEDGQEEIYLVLDGSARFEVAGEHVDAETGTLLRVAPKLHRNVVPGAEGVRLLAIGSTLGGTYERPAGFRIAGRA
jgi:mannose-6-phosphate isomerase-like protein (cupin superfamily)